MRRRRSLPMLRAAALGAGVTLLLTGCALSGSTPPGGDPGNRALHVLAADRIFTTVPSGAHVEGLHLIAAKYTQPGFMGGGWNGPTVTRAFTSAASPASVYRFFAARAQRGGWTVVTRNVLGLAEGWRKVFPDGRPASLALDGFDPRDQAPRPRTYQLDGSIVPGAPGRRPSGRNSS